MPKIRRVKSSVKIPSKVQKLSFGRRRILCSKFNLILLMSVSLFYYCFHQKIHSRLINQKADSYENELSDDYYLGDSANNSENNDDNSVNSDNQENNENQQSADDKMLEARRAVIQKVPLPVVNLAILVRVYPGDPHNWTKKDLQDWIYYYKYAGINHIFLYDHFNQDYKKVERVKKTIQDMDMEDFVSYHDWSSKNFEAEDSLKPENLDKLPKNLKQESARTIENIRKMAYNSAKLEGETAAKGSQTARTSAAGNFEPNKSNPADWQINLNLHEYIFSLRDQEQGFIQRMIQQTIIDKLTASVETFKNGVSVQTMKQEHITALNLPIKIHKDSIHPYDDGLHDELYVGRVAQRKKMSNFLDINSKTDTKKYGNSISAYHVKYLKDLPDFNDPVHGKTLRKKLLILDVNQDFFQVNRYFLVDDEHKMQKSAGVDGEDSDGDDEDKMGQIKNDDEWDQVDLSEDSTSMYLLADKVVEYKRELR